MNTKKIYVSIGPRGGLQIEYYVREKKVSPFVFVKSDAEDLTHAGNMETLGIRFVSKIQFNKRVDLSREAKRLGVTLGEYGYQLFLESFRK